MTAASKLIIDASVVIKLIAEEAGDAEQIHLLRENIALQKHKLAAPTLLEWELGNYLGRKLDFTEACSRLSYIKLLRISLYNLSAQHKELAFKIMHSVPGASFYDASYHALALSQNATFITCDYRYYEKSKQLGGVVLLTDYTKLSH